MQQAERLPSVNQGQMVQRSLNPSLLTVTLGLSLALHGTLLFLPFNREQPVQKPEPKPVKVTKITTISAIRNSLQPQSKPPTPARKLTVKSPISVSDRPTPPVASTAKPTQPVTNQTAPSPSQPGGNPLPAKSDAFAFTPYPEAEPGCLQLRSCFATSDGLDQVSQFFSQQLVADGYQVTLEVEEGDRRVFRFSRNGKSRYLSILNVEVSTIYAAADGPRTYADLQAAVEIPPEFEALLAQSTRAEPAAVNQFAEPDLFFTEITAAEVKPEISGPPLLLQGQTPEQFYNQRLKPNLAQLGFQIPDQSEGNYGEGPVYRMQQDSAKPFFVNLIPTRDRSGTIVIIWLALPIT